MKTVQLLILQVKLSADLRYNPFIRWGKETQVSLTGSTWKVKEVQLMKLILSMITSKPSLSVTYQLPWDASLAPVQLTQLMRLQKLMVTSTDGNRLTSFV